MSVGNSTAAGRSVRRARAWLAERPWRAALVAGLGGALTIGVLAALHAAETLPLLIPPFGASCVLVFGAPASPFARPRNVIGGHLISAAMGLGAVAAFGAGPLAIALGVGLAIAAMMLSDTVHPPAGANPIVVAVSGAGWPFLAAPILLGATVVVAMGMAYQRLRKGAGKAIGTVAKADAQPAVGRK
jgi:CBS-domain-containing membrane protein